ncbi:PfkB family carbohydrate kinase [Actinosynnema sp. NPDC047251]|uniref:Sugar kinase, ribokinase family protein n=1 Tax=Saccharothrix espanaensis (strain ATCC 51144 / DSM 44229 / JCM 9112 / NBRC 15066 / NRRL 15764) TaxID=1179773 RepID=K0KBM2_SACES|nr:PfkB family carbohydrate kinase [Saccharothrix espanaensis]CCH34947.1 Sugar kinase, ribokinase family protein [Saccharothrix espanaensis DSM 44229]
MPEVFVAGPASWNRLVSLDRLPEARPHTVFASGHRSALGGTSAGKALNLAALGARVTLRTVVGDDEAGRSIVGALDAPNVDLIAEVVPGASEQHLNLMSPDGGRVSIYLELPELAEPRHDDRALAALARADAAVIDLADSARPFLAAARAAGVPVWCDVHDYDGRSAYHQDFVDAADFLFLNDDGMPEPDLLAFLRTRPGTAVATRGARGAVAFAAGVRHEVAAVPVDRIVDTNGAGDAFFAGFLVAHLAGAGVPAALTAGAAQAARCLRSPNLAQRGARSAETG